MIKIRVWMSALLLGFMAAPAAIAADTLKAFPAAEAGMARHVLQLPRQDDESAFRVELIVGKTLPLDAHNRYFFGGRLQEEAIPGWGYMRYRLEMLKMGVSVSELRPKHQADSELFGAFRSLGPMLLAPMVVPMALKFGPPEYFSLMVLGLTTVAYLSGGSLVKALLMALLGLGVSVVGMDALTSKVRFTFGVTELWNGVDFVAVTMGLFAIPEILVSVENWARQEVFSTKIKGIWPNREEFRRSAGPMARGSALGFFTGIIPGGGPLLASFFSYALEKSISKHPEQFGTGAIEGVAGPEAANNSGTGGALVPLFALGLPRNVVTAIMLNAFIMQGLRPGPMLMQEQPQLFWGVVASMFIGNLVLLILNLPLVGLFVGMLLVPYRVLLPFIVLFCVIGAYAVNNQVFGVWLMLIFGVLGYFLRKGNYPATPVVLGLVIGPMLEGALRQALTVSQGDISVFFTRPLSLSMIVIALGVVSVPFWRKATRKKEVLRAPGDDPNVS